MPLQHFFETVWGEDKLGVVSAGCAVVFGALGLWGFNRATEYADIAQVYFIIEDANITRGGFPYVLLFMGVMAVVYIATSGLRSKGGALTTAGLLFLAVCGVALMAYQMFLMSSATIDLSCGDESALIDCEGFYYQNDTGIVFEALGGNRTENEVCGDYYEGACSSFAFWGNLMGLYGIGACAFFTFLLFVAALIRWNKLANISGSSIDKAFRKQEEFVAKNNDELSQGSGRH